MIGHTKRKCLDKEISPQSLFRYDYERKLFHFISVKLKWPKNKIVCKDSIKPMLGTTRSKMFTGS